MLDQLVTHSECTKCKQRFPISNFYYHKTRKSGIDAWCKSCHRKNQHQRYMANKALFAARGKKYRARSRDKIQARIRQRKFGITATQYDDLLRSQGGKCAICRRVERYRLPDGATRGLPVDHDHGTGRLRGLLCTLCNRGLGMFDDNLAILRAAVAYLEASE